MPQSAHARAAEFHLLAAHAHQSAATHHEKGDHLSAHELSRQAHEHAAQAWQWSQTAAQNSAVAGSVPQTGTLPFGLSAPHADNDTHAVSPAAFNPTMKYKSGVSGASGAPIGAAKSAPTRSAPKKAAPSKKASKPAKRATKSKSKSKSKSKKKPRGDQPLECGGKPPLSPQLESLTRASTRGCESFHRRAHAKATTSTRRHVER